MPGGLQSVRVITASCIARMTRSGWMPWRLCGTLYAFDAKTEAFIAAEVKGMDVHLASDPVLRMELAFEWSIKQDLDPKGPPFATFEGSGFLDGERRKFYAKHAKALPRAQELPAHVREAEDRKSAEQEATKGGRTLTPAEQTHASPQTESNVGSEGTGKARDRDNPQSW